MSCIAIWIEGLEQIQDAMKNVFEWEKEETQKSFGRSNLRPFRTWAEARKKRIGLNPLYVIGHKGHRWQAGC